MSAPGYCFELQMRRMGPEARKPGAMASASASGAFMVEISEEDANESARGRRLLIASDGEYTVGHGMTGESLIVECVEEVRTLDGE